MAASRVKHDREPGLAQHQTGPGTNDLEITKVVINVGDVPRPVAMHIGDGTGVWRRVRRGIQIGVLLASAPGFNLASEPTVAGADTSSFLTGQHERAIGGEHRPAG